MNEQQFLQLMAEMQNNSNYQGAQNPFLTGDFPASNTYQYPTTTYNPVDSSALQFRPNTDLQPTGQPNLGGAQPFNPFSDPLYSSLQSNTSINSELPNVATISNSNPQQRQAQFNPALYANLFTPYSTENAVFKLGQSLAFNSNNPNATSQQRGANTLRGIGAAGKTLSSLLRTGLSGAASENRYNEAFRDYELQQGAQDYRYLEDGGIIPQEQFMTGSYITEDPNTQANAEIEKNEYVQTPTGEVLKAVGNTHEAGGIAVNLEPNSIVISDNLKIGGKNSRDIKKQYDIDVKATDTFATVIDKYKKKLGLNKLDQRQEDLFKQLDKNQNVEQETTAQINEQFLGKQIQETEASKKPLQEQLSAFTTEVFGMQETLKGNDTQLVFENGGRYTTNQLKELFQKHNLSEEKGMEVVNAIKEYQVGGQVGFDYYNANPYVLPSYGNQSYTATHYLSGNVSNLDVATQRAQAQYGLLPYTLSSAGIVGANNAIVITPENIGAFQKQYNDYATATTTALDVNPNLTEQQRILIREGIQNQIFNQEGVRGFDSKYGDFTSSRSNFNLPYLTSADKQKYPQLKFLGDVVDKDGKIKDSYKDLDENTKQILTETVKKAGTSSFDIGLLTIPKQATTEQNVAQENQRIIIPNTGNRAAAYLNLPDQYLPPPSPLQAARMPNTTYRNYEPVIQGVDQQLQALANTQAASVAQIQGLSPEQAAIATAQIGANTQQAANQAIFQVNSANQQELGRVGNANTDLYNKFSALRESERERFEQKTYAGMNAEEVSLNNWYQYNNQLNLTNFRQRQQANTLDSIFPYATFNPDGRIISTGERSYLYTNNPIPTTESDKKKK